MAGIKYSEITVVVQGAIVPIKTVQCLKSIRRRLPGATVILSTWDGSDINGLDFDEIILNKDPGGFVMGGGDINNVKRQIASTLAGVKLAKTKYTLKIRTDMKIRHTGFLKYVHKFNNYKQEEHFLKERIIIPSYYSRNPEIWESAMCPSDWASFGLTVDMLNLWNIPYPEKEEEIWFKTHQIPDYVRCITTGLVARYFPEQFIWCNFVRKYKKVVTDNMFDVSPQAISETLHSFANNLIILSMKQFGLEFLKPPRAGSDGWHIITYKEFLSIYNRYSLGKKYVPRINWQRIRLFKDFLQSYKRLWRINKRNGTLLQFIKKEVKYYLPFIYWVLWRK